MWQSAVGAGLAVVYLGSPSRYQTGRPLGRLGAAYCTGHGIIVAGVIWACSVGPTVSQVAALPRGTTQESRRCCGRSAVGWLGWTGALVLCGLPGLLYSFLGRCGSGLPDFGFGTAPRVYIVAVAQRGAQMSLLSLVAIVAVDKAENGP